MLKKDNVFEVFFNDNQTFFVSENLLIATGSSKDGHEFSKKSFSHTIIKPIPSLFSFNIKNFYLKNLSGVSLFNPVEVKIKNTKFKQ